MFWFIAQTEMKYDKVCRGARQWEISNISQSTLKHLSLFLKWLLYPWANTHVAWVISQLTDPIAVHQLQYSHSNFTELCQVRSKTGNHKSSYYTF
jgi:hypothetical protein